MHLIWNGNENEKIGNLGKYKGSCKMPEELKENISVFLK